MRRVALAGLASWFLLSLSAGVVESEATPTRTDSAVAPEVAAVIVHFLAFPAGSVPPAIREIASPPHWPERMHRYLCDIPAAAHRGKSSAVVTVDVQRLYVMIAVFRLPPAPVSVELSQVELQRVAEQFLATRYPQVKDAYALSPGEPMRTELGVLFTWSAEGLDISTGARAGVVVLQSGEIGSCAAYFPPAHPVAPVILKAEAEQAASLALLSPGLEVDSVKSRLWQAHPMAPQEGPVWVVTVQMKPTLGATGKANIVNKAIIDAVTGQLLSPVLREEVTEDD